MSNFNLGVYCPSGGDFYICQHGLMHQFLGCCTSNPCLNPAGSCPLEDLRTLSFNAATYDQIRPQTCFDGLSTDWYACNQTSPAFLGCCLSNACNTVIGCPRGDLRPASLLNSEDSGLFATMATSIPAPQSSNISEAPVAASSKIDPPSSSSQSSNTVLSPWAWAGISAAGVASFALIVALLYNAFRKIRNKRAVPATPHEDTMDHQGDYVASQPGESVIEPSVPGQQELQGSHPDNLGTQNLSAGSLGLNLLTSPHGLPIYEAHRSHAQDSCQESSRISQRPCRYDAYRPPQAAINREVWEQSTEVSKNTRVQPAEPFYELE